MNGAGRQYSSSGRRAIRRFCARRESRWNHCCRLCAASGGRQNANLSGRKTMTRRARRVGYSCPGCRRRHLPARRAGSAYYNPASTPRHSPFQAALCAGAIGKGAKRRRRTALKIAGFAGPRRIFPLRLRRQGIALSGLRRQPACIALGVAPRNIDNRAIAAAPSIVRRALCAAAALTFQSRP